MSCAKLLPIEGNQSVRDRKAFRMRAMYSPHYNRFEDRDEILAFVRRHSFAVLVTSGEGGMRASHLPSLVQDEEGRFVVEMHMARANDQWRQFGGAEALV